MTRHTVYLVVCSSLWAAAMLFDPAYALANHSRFQAIDVAEAPFMLLSQAAANKSQAMKIAEDVYGGKALSARLHVGNAFNSGGTTKTGTVWKVKLLFDSGKVKYVSIEATASS